MIKWGLTVLAALGIFFSFAYEYNHLQKAEEQLIASWVQVTNQYQRRTDLIPGLVKTIKSFALEEKAAFKKVTEARNKTRPFKFKSELLNDVYAFKQYEFVQNNISEAISKLMIISENYPQLKSDKNFLYLQMQLDGTQTRIAMARERYSQSLQEYHITIQAFPANLFAMIFGFNPKPSLIESSLEKPEML